MKANKCTCGFEYIPDYTRNELCPECNVLLHRADNNSLNKPYETIPTRGNCHCKTDDALLCDGINCNDNIETVKDATSSIDKEYSELINEMVDKPKNLFIEDYSLPKEHVEDAADKYTLYTKECKFAIYNAFLDGAEWQREQSK